MVLLGLGPEGPGAASAHRETGPRADAFRRSRVRAVGSVWSGVRRSGVSRRRRLSKRLARQPASRRWLASEPWPLRGWSRRTASAGSTRWPSRRSAAPPCPAFLARCPKALGLVGEQPVPSASHPEGCVALAVSSSVPRRVPLFRLRPGRPEGSPCRCRPSASEEASCQRGVGSSPEGGVPLPCHPRRPEGRWGLPAAFNTPKSPVRCSPAPLPEGREAGRHCAALPKEVPLVPDRVSRRRPGVDQTTASFLIASHDGVAPRRD